MKNQYKLLLIVCFVYGFSIVTSCQNKAAMTDQNGGNSKTFSKPEDAATSALNVLSELASNANTKGAISLSAEEVKQLKVGTPIPLIEISYESLLKANADSMPAPITPTTSTQSRWLFPLEINGNAATTAVVYGAGNSWELHSTGDNRYVNNFLARKRESTADIIEVPGLGVDFLRYKENEVVLYISDKDIPEADITKDRPMPERQALQALVRYARIFESKYGPDIKNKKLTD